MKHHQKRWGVLLLITIIYIASVSGWHVSAQELNLETIEAPTATISAASLNNTSYVVGDTITAQVVWYTGVTKVASRATWTGKGKELEPLVMNLNVMDKDNNPCAQPVFTTVFSEDISISISAIATANCDSPHARVSLLSATRALLSTKDIFMGTLERPDTSEQTSIDSHESTFSAYTTMKFVALCILVLVVIMGLIIIQRSRKSEESNKTPSL